MPRQLTTSEFISKAQAIHHNKYEYAKATYIGRAVKLTITCPVHGDYTQSPNLHLRGSGCTKCSYEKKAIDKRKSNYDVINEFNAVHGEIYDYSEMVYVNTDTPITIICDTHGIFTTTPHRHIHSRVGCQKCNTSQHPLTIKVVDFKHRASTLHEFKYDYSLITYRNSKDLITIICPKHGEFVQTCSSHLYGAGCKQCSIEQRAHKQSMGIKRFVELSTITHCNKYGYNDVQYHNNRTNVNISCPIHGIFKQTPTSHLRGSGCPQCGVECRSLQASKSSTQFINEAVMVHGNAYGYSDVIYHNTHTNVDILCPTHGIFKQTPTSHLRGHGCKRCSQDDRTYTSSSFAKQASLIHNNYYSYDNVVYGGIMDTVKITCPIHGDFDQIGNVHMRGGGCKTCVVDNLRKTTANFIVEASKKHQQHYTYNKINYINNYTKVTITCPKHGNFNQIPSTHLHGAGCSQCAWLGRYDYNRLTTDPDLVNLNGTCYFIKFSNINETFYKIGITTNLAKRFGNTSSGYIIEKLAHVDTSLLQAFILEQNVLHVHALTKYTPLQKFGGHTECLTLSPEDVDNIISLLHSISSTTIIEPLFKC